MEGGELPGLQFMAYTNDERLGLAVFFLAKIATLR